MGNRYKKNQRKFIATQILQEWSAKGWELQMQLQGKAAPGLKEQESTKYFSAQISEQRILTFQIYTDII